MNHLTDKTSAPESTSTRQLSAINTPGVDSSTVDLDSVTRSTSITPGAFLSIDLDQSAALASWALAYAAAGVPIVPLFTPLPDGSCSCRRADCRRIGKHPRTPNGLTDASTKLDTVAAWWTRWPDANIGGVTGVVFDVCDVDGSHGVVAVRDVLDQASHGRAPLVRTGGGGWHLFFAPTGHGNRGKMLPDVDWRGAGGYVVLPPSLHVSRHRYAWARGAQLLPSVPAPLLAVVAPPRVQRRGGQRIVGKYFGYAEVALDNELRALGAVGEGGRNHALNRAAYSLGQLVGSGQLEETRLVDDLTATALSIGLGAREAERTIASGLAAGMRNPRRRAGREAA